MHLHYTYMTKCCICMPCRNACIIYPMHILTMSLTGCWYLFLWAGK